MTESEFPGLAEASHWDYATFPRRFAAGLIDLVLIMAVFEASVIALPSFRFVLEEASAAQEVATLARINLVMMVLIYLYYLFSLYLPGRGASIGYRAVGIKVVNERTGEPPSLLRAFMWCVGSVLISVGFVTYWLNSERKMLHNAISGTAVVRGRVPMATPRECYAALKNFWASIDWHDIRIRLRLLAAEAWRHTKAFTDYLRWSLHRLRFGRRD